MTKTRAPDSFKSLLVDRDAVMAGHLHALAADEDLGTIVAAVGVQHLTIVVDFLSKLSDIADDLVKFPPLAHYRLFPRIHRGQMRDGGGEG